MPVALLLLAALAAPGCVTRRWDYQPQSGRAYQPLPLTAGVLVPFEDARPAPTLDANTVPLGLIPLVLWGTITRHQPEGGGGRRAVATTIESGTITQREREIRQALATLRDREERARLEGELDRLVRERAAATIEVSGEDLPDAAAISLFLELRAAAMFEDVRLVRSAREAQECDVVFRGRLIATDQRTAVLWYGLSLGGPALWLIGFPSQTYHVRTAYEVVLLDYRGRPMDRYRHHDVARTEAAWKWGAHYYRVLPTMWAGINRRVLRDAQDFFASRPRDYWMSYDKEAGMAQRGR